MLGEQPPGTQEGVLQLTMEDIFSKHAQQVVMVSYLEIYNEHIYDLLEREA